MSSLRAGQRVRALETITEDGTLPGDPNGEFYDPHFIHAVPGDLGVVEEVDEEDVPLVRFERTGTATILNAGVVEAVP